VYKGLVVNAVLKLLEIGSLGLPDMEQIFIVSFPKYIEKQFDLFFNKETKESIDAANKDSKIPLHLAAESGYGIIVRFSLNV
jgi:hypothetical protein